MKFGKSRTATLSWTRHVVYDCTAGLPTGCEPYGNGVLIVVSGVTTTHGGWFIDQLQGEGEQVNSQLGIWRYA